MQRTGVCLLAAMGVSLAGGLLAIATTTNACAAESEGVPVIQGTVQNQDLRRVGQVLVEVKDQEGNVAATAVSNDAGEFAVAIPMQGTYSVSAVRDTFRSEYVVLMIGRDALKPVTLTLSQSREIALEVVSPLAPMPAR